MHSTVDRPLGIYYEHPDWFRPLFAELDRRGISYERIDARSHRFDPAESQPRHAVVLNRMSPSAYLRGHQRAVFYTTEYLRHLQRIGVRVINGIEAWQTEISKASQLALLSSLGLPVPRARVINDPAQAPGAADGLRFPVVVKPNIGGSGAGVRRFETPQGLRAVAEAGQLDIGIDNTALVQEYIPQEGRHITRVEVLGGRFLYAIRIYTSGDSFNLCPADLCLSVDGAELDGPGCALDAPRNGLSVEGCTPAPEIIDAVERIAAAAGIEVGGVEYFIDARDGQLYYYDVNALSNFVADAPRVVGFDPFARLVDYIVEQAHSVGTLAQHAA